MSKNSKFTWLSLITILILIIVYLIIAIQNYSFNLFIWENDYVIAWGCINILIVAFYGVISYIIYEYE